jgi:electron transfer flavoprotein beta subunit
VGGDGSVSFSRAKPAISEYDPVAIELGRQLADANGAELIGLSLGSGETASSMAKKAALARGLDRAVLVIDEAFDQAGATETALQLAAAVESIGEVDLVLTGDSSIDMGSRMVGAIMGGALGWPTVTEVRSVAREGATWTAERIVDGVRQTLAIDGPAVLAVAADAVVPRVPGMKDILQAGKKPTDDRAAEAGIQVGAVEVVAQSKPQLKARQGVLIDGSNPDEAAATLASALRQGGLA